MSLRSDHPLSASERVLDIPELFLCILGHIGVYARHSAPGNAAQWTQTLVSIGLTCRAFLEPALDELWSHLASLEPLLQLFPEDCYKHEAQTFSRHPEGRDWARFDHFAAKVRSLAVPPTSDPEVCRTLCAARSARGYLLPFLRSLDWPGLDGCAGLTPHLRHFLHSQVTLLSTGLPLTSDYPSCFDLIRERCPRLTFLELQSPFGHGEWAAVSQLVCSLDHLRVLRAYEWPVSADAMQHLASLPSLSELCISLAPDDVDSYLPEALHYHGSYFPALEKLRINSTHDTHRILAPLIERVQSSSLRGVQVWLLDSTGSTALPDLASVLGAHRSRESLRNVALIVGQQGFDTPATDNNNERIGLAALRPLFTLTNLTALSLFSGALAVDDALVAALADAYPALTHLTLRCETPAMPKVTLGGLRALAERCSRLRYIVVRMDATMPALPDWPPRPEVPNVSVKHVELLGSTISDAEVLRTGSYLSALFPELQYVKAELDGPWAKVRKLLGEMRKAREEAEALGSVSEAVGA